jgi:hypothetical protein
MNARQAIIKDAEVRAILDNLLAGPKRILGQQDALEDATHEASIFNEETEYKDKLANIEAETAFLVRNEKDETTGKAKYTNEEQRASAVRLVCIKDKEYIDTLSALTAAQHKHAELKMRIGKLVNQVKYATNEYYAYKTALEVVAGLAVEDIDGAAFAKLAQIKALVKTIEEK